MLIIGCGNRQRGDDGAGLLAAERLRELGIQAEMRAGEAADLIETWQHADDVIIIDAVMTGAPAGTVQSWDGRQSLVSLSPTISTHGFGVAEAIALAHALERLPNRLRVYGVEGRSFEPGAAISPEVMHGVEEVVRRIVAGGIAPHESSPAMLPESALSSSPHSGGSSPDQRASPAPFTR
jgi:hydrogenase maturation protease